MSLHSRRHSTSFSPMRNSTRSGVTVQSGTPSARPCDEPCSPLADRRPSISCPGGLHRLVAAVTGSDHRDRRRSVTRRTIDTTPAPLELVPHPQALNTNLFHHDRLPRTPMRPEPDGLRPAPCATTPHTTPSGIGDMRGLIKENDAESPVVAATETCGSTHSCTRLRRPLFGMSGFRNGLICASHR